jgi:hypothetical protein
VFPVERVFQLIDGRQVVKAHGDSQMPVWGDGFSKSVTGADEAAIKAKIEALVKYLESIQERQARRALARPPATSRVSGDDRSQFTTVFSRPGDYLIVCHEFCGNRHHAMFGRSSSK